jgi:hypothetical protein
MLVGFQITAHKNADIRRHAAEYISHNRVYEVLGSHGVEYENGSLLVHHPDDGGSKHL